MRLTFLFAQQFLVLGACLRTVGTDRELHACIRTFTVLGQVRRKCHACVRTVPTELDLTNASSLWSFLLLLVLSPSKIVHCLFFSLD